MIRTLLCLSVIMAPSLGADLGEKNWFKTVGFTRQPAPEAEEVQKPKEPAPTKKQEAPKQHKPISDRDTAAALSTMGIIDKPEQATQSGQGGNLLGQKESELPSTEEGSPRAVETVTP